MKEYLIEKYLNEASREKMNVKYNGVTYDIYYQPPKGYYAKSVGSKWHKAKKNIISIRYFDKEEDAKEHAEREIDGYVDENE